MISSTLSVSYFARYTWQKQVQINNGNPYSCPLSDFELELNEIAAENKKIWDTAEDKKDAKQKLIGIHGNDKFKWAGQYAVISLDTDFHKKEGVIWDDAEKNKRIEDLKGLSSWLAIVQPPNGGVASINLVDTHTLPLELTNGKKPSPEFNGSYKWFPVTDEIREGLEAAKDRNDVRYVGCNNNQMRFFTEVLSFNCNCIPFQYVEPEKVYLAKCKADIIKKQEAAFKTVDDFNGWLNGDYKSDDVLYFWREQGLSQKVCKPPSRC